MRVFFFSFTQKNTMMPVTEDVVSFYRCSQMCSKAWERRCENSIALTRLEARLQNSPRVIISRVPALELTVWECRKLPEKNDILA